MFNEKQSKRLEYDRRLDLALKKEIETGDTFRFKILSDEIIRGSVLKKKKIETSRDPEKNEPEKLDPNSPANQSKFAVGQNQVIKMLPKTVAEGPRTLIKIPVDEHPIVQVIEQPKLPNEVHNTLYNIMKPNSQNIAQFPLIKSVKNFVKRVAFRTRTGWINGKPKLNNQDSTIIQSNLHGIKGQYLFAICDGHGPFGHLVSEHIKQNYISNLQLYLPLKPSKKLTKKALIQGSIQTDESLKLTKIDLTRSGATMISVLISASKLYSASLGNCRGFIANYESRWAAVGIHTVHTLQNTSEKERLVKNSARIEVELVRELGKISKKEIGYLGNSNFPGLEITRSIGDKLGKFIGFIPSPDVCSYKLSSSDKFVVIGSPGLWNTVSETDALTIVRPFWEENKVEAACEALISESDRRYLSVDNYKEDTSVIVIFLSS